MANRTRALVGAALLLLAVSNCRSAGLPGPEEKPVYMDVMPELSAVQLAEGGKLRVMATTSIVADVVKNVGGEWIELKTLLPVGTDPHSFVPTPQDVAAVAKAHVLFVNGAGLEVFLEPLLSSAGNPNTVVPVSYGTELLKSEGEQQKEELHQGGDFDPHTWFDPNNVIVWTTNIQQALSVLNPEHATAYEANASRYKQALIDLDAWIRKEVAQVPQAKRQLVMDHTIFTYFAHRYGFGQIGAVLPGYSTVAQPSARELAALEAAIRAHDVKAVFVGRTVNPGLAQQVAKDTGRELAFLYTGSLSKPDGEADTYLAMMRYNVSAMVNALR